MSTKSTSGPQRCRLILQQCLAIQLTKPGHVPEDFWMYDSGYMIFQNFLAANAQCWWNAPLTAATRALKYAGHVAPGMLLVTAEPCALEVLRSAYARRVLKPPATYIISSVGDIDDCILTPTAQGHFTPLPEALCDVIMNLTSDGESATIENIRTRLEVHFPHMVSPPVEVIYDTLAQLMQEQKIYQTSKGYFIFTPERRRSRSRPRTVRNINSQEFEENDEYPKEARIMLMTNAEALHSLYGEISTERDGDLTHQCIQTNLADVICGGNPNDKILYPRISKRRSASFPTPRSLERRHSLRLFGSSSKRLQRCASTRSLSKAYAQTLTTDSSSSEYQSTDSSSPKKGSLLSRLFRRSGRSKQRQIETYSAQFPPVEWFNSKAVHLHSKGTQTDDHDLPTVHTLSNSTFYDGSEFSHRSSTLPRRHRRHMSSESNFLISLRDCSPIRRRSPVYCNNSLPRSTPSITNTTNSTATTVENATTATTTAAHGETNYTYSRLSTPNSQICSQTINSGQKTTPKNVCKSAFERSPSRTSFSTKAFKKRELESCSTNSYASISDSKSSQRNIQSGPSSFESGKASYIMTSGPSSIDSSKISFSKTSGHSSLDSQYSVSTTVKEPSPARSILMLNESPRGTPRHQVMRARAAEQDHNFQKKTTNHGTSSTTSGESQRNSTDLFNNVPNSNSSNSITLQVTTNGSQTNIPNTKIFVQNSPVRSVITLENGKLTENSVYIINNETVTNEKGEIIKKTLSRQQNTHLRHQHAPTPPHNLKDRPMYISENDTNSDTFDSISFETTPSTLTTETLDSLSSEVQLIGGKTIGKNNDSTMNNSRKLCLQLPTSNPNNLIIKNNVLKNDSHNIIPPIADRSLIAPLAKEDMDVSGSAGNLQFYEKSSDCQSKLMNSNCDLKNLRYESSGSLQKVSAGNLLNSNPTINGNDLAHLLQKNLTAVGSEPNLALKDSNCITALDKAIEKEAVDRRLSLSKDNSNIAGVITTGNDELYNFPSLSDLSFNFTSLAAQKILQGVSLNSIDTLVELNMAAAAAAVAAVNTSKEKQQNNQPAPAPICTDFGMV